MKLTNFAKLKVWSMNAIKNHRYDLVNFYNRQNADSIGQNSELV